MPNQVLILQTRKLRSREVKVIVQGYMAENVGVYLGVSLRTEARRAGILIS